jgi:hypothetical protein
VNVSMKKIFLLNLIVTLYGGTLFCMDNSSSHVFLSKNLDLENNDDDSNYISTSEDEEETSENDSKILKNLKTKIERLKYLEGLRYSELRIQKKDKLIEEIYKNIEKVIQLTKSMKTENENFESFVQEMEEINFSLQEYIDGNNNLTSQHLVPVLNKIFPIIETIQKVAEENKTNDSISIPLNKKIIIAILSSALLIIHCS